MKHTLDMALPDGFRAADVATFHGRDTAQLAEQVDANGIRKGILLDGAPLLLTLQLQDGVARCTADGAAALTPDALRAVLLNVLGLRIDPAPFMALARDDALLGPVVARLPGLRIVQSATVFEALTWAVIGQQINLPFAISLRRSFIALAGRQHDSGLWCYPEAADVARLTPDLLGQHKFSRAKADTLIRVAQLVDTGALPLQREDDMERASAALLAVKGIGPWTVNYTLLRGYGYADCSLHGDVAVRGALQRLLGEESKPDMARTAALLARYAPQRTMAAAYLWASLQHPVG